jgi:hypothetical protein
VFVVVEFDVVEKFLVDVCVACDKYKMLWEKAVAFGVGDIEL